MQTLDVSAGSINFRYQKSKAIQEWFLRASLGLLVFLSPFVWMEPAPYDLLATLLLPLVLLTLVRIPLGVFPLIVLILVYAGFGYLSIPFTKSTRDPWMYMIVNSYLAMTAIYFACIIAHNPQKHMKILSETYAFVACLITVIGVAAYFSLMPSAESFLRFGRVMATFQDPNVYGPYLVYPAVFALFQAILVRGYTLKFYYLLVVLICTIGVFFSFSRGAWFHLALSFVLLFALIFLFVRDRRIKKQTWTLVLLGLLVLVGAFLYLLSLEEVRTLFDQRASLSQSYDVSRLGRFARHSLGFGMIIEAPLGFGPFHFGYLFGEDPHNVYLNAFWTHGWIGGAAYVILILWTLWKGVKLLTKQRPWQRYVFVTFATFLPLCIEGWIIDTDRWRHFYMLLGIMWAFIALDVAAKRRVRAAFALRQVSQEGQ